MAHRFFTKILILCFAVVLGGLIGAQPVSAETGSEACDSDFNDVMHARARLEAMREMEIAQALILKPDSVLEYSCFRDNVIELGNQANFMFSDNTKGTLLFKDPPQEFSGSSPLPTITEDQVTAPNTGQTQLRRGPNPPGGDLHGARLNNVLGVFINSPSFDYNVSNFGHAYAGGTISEFPINTDTCHPMQFVWKFLKCVDFQKSSFRTFEELAFFDPRVVPSYLPLSCNNSNRSPQWSSELSKINSASGKAEPVKTYLGNIASSSCETVQPVFTGVTVFRTQDGSSQNFEDAICPAAGCYFDGSGGCQ